MYNDAEIASKVREAILLNPQVSAQDIHVAVFNRVVMLTGGVDTMEQKAQAILSAAEVEGVEFVEDNLHVRSGSWPPVELEILPWRGEG